MAKLPIVTPTKKFDIKFVNGQPIFDLREQIINILTQDAKSGVFREFFAEPIVNHSKGEISWYSHGSGDVRPFTDLSNDERRTVLEAIQDIDLKLKATADRMSKASPQSAWLGDAMRSMLLVPNLEQSLFLVGGQPVLSQWGCVPFGSDPRNFEIANQKSDIIVRDAGTPIPVVPEANLPAVEPPAAVPQAEPPAPVPPLPTPPPEPLESERPLPPPPASNSFDWRQLLPWLLALLLLLLLLLGLYLNYFNRFHYLMPGYSVEIDRERGEIDRLWGAIEERSRQCPAPVPPVDFSRVPNVPADGPDATPNVPPIGSNEVDRRLETNNIPIGEEVNISLAWDTLDDLDLYVTDPSGETIFHKHRRSSTGGQLDIDAHENCSQNVPAPIENISWNSLPLAGVYTIKVRHYSTCGNSNTPVPFTLIIKLKDALEKRITGTVDADHQQYEYQFNVGGR